MEVRNLRILRTIPLLIGISLISMPAEAKYGGGSGEPNDPYLIYTVEQMNAIGADANDWDKHFKLMADIDLASYTGTEFNIIGTGYYEIPPFGLPYLVSTPFTGTFDGNGFEISNLNYKASGEGFEGFIYCIGLFGVVDGINAKIKNLGLKNVNIDVDPGDRIGSLIGILVNGMVIGCYIQDGSVSGDYRVGGLVGLGDSNASIIKCYSNTDVSGYGDIGGLVGQTYYSTISDCFSTGNVIGTGYHAGGLIGINYYGEISNCYSTCIVLGKHRVGGLVGETRGNISNCYATGNVTGSGIYVGGLVGYNSGKVSDCYSTSSVNGDEYVGGLVGNNGGKIFCCYSTGGVIGTANVGGLVGRNRYGSITSSFWDIQTSGQATSARGTGKTTAEMQTASTFLDASWDFTNIWGIGENQTYPFLIHHPTGDLNYDGCVGLLDLAILAEHWLEDKKL